MREFYTEGGKIQKCEQPILALLFTVTLFAEDLPLVTAVEHQPLAAQVMRLVEALQILGEPLPAGRGHCNFKSCAAATSAKPAAVAAMQKILDRHCLVGININPESRVKAQEGPAKAELVEQGWRTFPGQGAERGRHHARAGGGEPQRGHAGWKRPKAWSRAVFSMSRCSTSSPCARACPGSNWSTASCSSTRASRQARGAAQLQRRAGHAGPGLPQRHRFPVHCTKPATKVTFRVLDSDDRPTTGSFLIRDAQDRVYPSQAKRLAPDFAFQPQIYRADGEFVLLPPGEYTDRVHARPGVSEEDASASKSRDQPMEIAFRLDRWIDPAKMGWYSGDHHIHAAGCAHYEKPTEGVYPEDMMRHILGEDLKVGSVLSWGPSWYFQKTFFEGKDNALSTKENLMRYDVEVSGFPSSHTGHICLLGLKEEDYPGTKRIEDWPSWGLPVFRWAKTQGAVAGFAHSGWGLALQAGKAADRRDAALRWHRRQRIHRRRDARPGGFHLHGGYAVRLGAEHLVSHAELGYRTRISGETDFPCIYGERVGLGRSYVRQTSKLDYRDWADGIREGPQLRLRRQEPPDGFQGERRGDGLRRKRAASARNPARCT